MRRSKGLYGSYVCLALSDSNGVVTLTQQRGAKINADGSFSINYTYNADLQQFRNIVLLVGKNNDASYLTSGGIFTQINAYNFFPLSQSFQTSFSPSQTQYDINNTDIVINSEEGALLRNMQLAREFVVQLYDGNLTFGLPKIEIRSGEPNVGANATLYTFPVIDPHIIIRPNRANSRTCMHEYGHYVHYSLYKDGYGGMMPSSLNLKNTPESVKEGWADFYSFAGRNYANKVYGDDLRREDYNYEESFLGFSGYLWNLYDGYQDGNFAAALYDVGDNDDVDGRELGRKMFDVIDRMKPDYNILGFVSKMYFESDFNNMMKSGLSTDLQNAIQVVYNGYVANSNGNMHPPQIKGLYGYDPNGSNPESNQIMLKWSSQAYHSNVVAQNRNQETGYRIYRDNILIGDFAVNTQSSVHNFTDIYNCSFKTNIPDDHYHEYFVSSYNNTGEAINRLRVTTGFGIFLSGSEEIRQGQMGYWNLQIRGGNSPKIEWYKNNTLVATNVYNYSCSGGTGEFVIRVKATDGGIVREAEILVKVYCPTCPVKNSVDTTLQTSSTYDISEFALKYYPNPMLNSTFSFDFDLPEEGEILLEWYNQNGNFISTWEKGQRTSQHYSLTYETQNFATGFYYLRFKFVGKSGKFIDYSIKLYKQ